MRRFNTTGLCVPRKHYMVDVSGRVAQMRAMVDAGDYFCVNRPRQYGKTTTLAALRQALVSDYEVAGLSFQRLSHADFASEAAFVRALCRNVPKACRTLPAPVAERMREVARDRQAEWVMGDLFELLEEWVEQSCRPVVLVVDEVDSATGNQVFLDFLARLRDQYLLREEDPSYPAFQSVILAGVTDVKHLKARIRPEEQARPNSPWNIAADFKVNMSFSAADVAGMLADYDADHATGMDADAVAAEIVAWTGGYPFLASRICQLVDEGGLGWDHEGLDAAVKSLLVESNTLFESLAGKLESYPDLRALLRSVLMEGERLPYSPDHDGIAQLSMYGFVRRADDNSVRIANRVFETRLYDLFILEDRIAGSRVYSEGEFGRSKFVRGGRLDMCAVLEGFREAYGRVWGPIEEGEHFSEFDGRRQFLLFLKPIINGTGNYYIEAQTRDQTRTDVVVDYAGEQFVVELKVWYGRARHEEGEEQLRGYLEHFGLDVGYMLSFNFNKHKEPGLRRVAVGDRVLWEETI